VLFSKRLAGEGLRDAVSNTGRGHYSSPAGLTLLFGHGVPLLGGMPNIFIVKQDDNGESQFYHYHYCYYKSRGGSEFENFRPAKKRRGQRERERERKFFLSEMEGWIKAHGE